MKIALIGYGKMGKAIEELALQDGHEIILKITSENLSDLNWQNLKLADVAIEFTNPHSAIANIKTCIDAGVPVVSGSTGWLEKLEEVTKYCMDNNGSFLYASNFSIGVNLFFELNKQLARLMNNRPQYHVAIEEIHHTQKKDAPSGTAITIAEGIIENITGKEKWILGPTENTTALSIHSKRIDPAPGTHIVTYASSVDSIEIKHTAHNRMGFANGAILAAEFLKDKKGIFGMKDVLNIC